MGVHAFVCGCVQAAAGFTSVMSILQAAGKPVVGHNMLFDLIYVLNIFVADFPAWPDFKAATEAWFPGGIYDTKHLTNALEQAHPAHPPGGGNGGGGSPPLFDSTTLGDLYEALVEGKRAEGATGRWRELLEKGCGVIAALQTGTVLRLCAGAAVDFASEHQDLIQHSVLRPPVSRYMHGLGFILTRGAASVQHC